MIDTAIAVNEPDQDVLLNGFKPLHIPPFVDFKTREEWLSHRAVTIGGTDVPALFEGLLENATFADDAASSILHSTLNLRDSLELSPYKSLWGLWMEKKGLAPRDNNQANNARVSWGTRLEEPIAYGIASEHNLTIHKASRYYLHPRIERMGASLDFEAEIAIDGQTVLVPFEIKNVSSTELRKWSLPDGRRVVPPHIALQVMHQLSVTGAPFALIGVLFDGSTAELLLMHRKSDIIRIIETAVDDFWRRFDVDDAPVPDYERDAELIRKIYADSLPGSTVSWSRDKEAKTLVARYQELANERKRLKGAADKIETELKSVEARLLEKLGNAETGDLGTILFSAKTVPEAQMQARTRSAYRLCKVKKKVK